MRNAKLLAALVLLVGSQPATAQSPEVLTREQREALEQQVQRELLFKGVSDCKPGMERCWYLLFGSGDAPYRKLFLADLRVRTPRGEKDAVEIDVIEAHETDLPEDKVANDFTLMTLQVRCKQKKFRVFDGYALQLDGKVDRAPGPTPWFAVPKSWFELAARAACDSEVQLRPLAYEMAWLGSQYRPIDAVDYVRRYLWNQSLRPQ